MYYITIYLLLYYYYITCYHHAIHVNCLLTNQKMWLKIESFLLESLERLQAVSGILGR